ncbi:MAG: hypothetical protein ACO3IV_06790, partial [Ilumatobacteraceae bacterium]
MTRSTTMALAALLDEVRSVFPDDVAALNLRIIGDISTVVVADVQSDSRDAGAGSLYCCIVG